MRKKLKRVEFYTDNDNLWIGFENQKKFSINLFKKPFLIHNKNGLKKVITPSTIGDYRILEIYEE